MSKLPQAILRSDLMAFVEKAMPVLMQGSHYLQNWHIDEITRELEQMISGKRLRVIVNIHPRIGKSLICSVILPMFLLVRDPSVQIFCLSYAQSLASEFHQKCRMLAHEEWYLRLNPDLKFKSGSSAGSLVKETDELLQTTRGGFRAAKSFNGSITGKGADWIILDDPNDMSQINSENHRANINTIFDNTLSTRLNGMDGRVLLVTQRGHVDDLSGHLLEKGNFHHFVIEAIATQDQKIRLTDGTFHLRKKGTPIDNRRFDLATLEERRRDLGNVGFEAQYQQNPMPAEGRVFKREWLQLVDEVPEFQYVVITADIATTLDGGDYSAFLVFGYHNGVWYLTAAHRVQRDLPGVIDFYKGLDFQYEPDATGFEQDGVGKPFLQFLKKDGFRHVQGATVSGDKVQRAVGVTPVLERGEVAILCKMPGFAPFMEELLNFPATRYDDMVDAFTFCLTHGPGILRVANKFRHPSRRGLPEIAYGMINIMGLFPTKRVHLPSSYFD